MKISIIIPIYNSEKYLRQCLNSVQSQTFADFEVLLINDGSNDNSGKICDEYAAKDTRIKVFHKENGGVSSARNLGIDEAEGEWICFVDSDDVLEENYLTTLVKSSVDSKADFIAQGFKKFGNGIEKNMHLGVGLFSASDFRTLFQIKKIQNFGFPFSKLFRGEIIKKHQISFPISFSIAEDLAFMLMYLSKIQTIQLDAVHHYLYRQVDNSLSNRLREPSIYFNRYNELKRIFKEEFNEVYIDLYNETHTFFSLKHTLGSALFQSILSLYFFRLNKGSRLTYLQKINKEDKALISDYKRSFRNPVFKFSLYLIEHGKYRSADFILKAFFTIRKLILKTLGKPLHYKFKK